MKPNILFLCTGNACRSQMAEGFARALRSETLAAYSAGVVAKGLDPRAVAVMNIGKKPVYKTLYFWVIFGIVAGIVLGLVPATKSFANQMQPFGVAFIRMTPTPVTAKMPV